MFQKDWVNLISVDSFTSQVELILLQDVWLKIKRIFFLRICILDTKQQKIILKQV